MVACFVGCVVACFVGCVVACFVDCVVACFVGCVVVYCAAYRVAGRDASFVDDVVAY